MMFILLSSNVGSWGEMLFAMFLLFGGISLIAILYSYGISTKEAKDKGGIKGIYPSVIKFIAQSYPNTRIVIDTTLYITMESNDTIKGVTRKFSLRLNPDTCRLTVSGTIIPDNSKWAWIPKTNHSWLIGLPSWEPEHYESTIIDEIKKDMVFNPEGVPVSSQSSSKISLAQYLNNKSCDIDFILDTNKNVVGKLSNGERIELNIEAQNFIKFNGIGKLSDYIVEDTIYNGIKVRSTIKPKDNTSPIIRR